jgi:hypothetical protein
MVPVPPRKHLIIFNFIKLNIIVVIGYVIVCLTLMYLVLEGDVRSCKGCAVGAVATTASPETIRRYSGTVHPVIAIAAANRITRLFQIREILLGKLQIVVVGKLSASAAVDLHIFAGGAGGDGHASDGHGAAAGVLHHLLHLRA